MSDFENMMKALDGWLDGMSNEYVTAFDQWLDEIRAEAWDEGFTDGVNHDLGDWENAPSIINNPYRQEPDA